jgi:hypothetical protein
MLRRLAVGTVATGASLVLLATPALAQDCFLTHASPTSHQGNSARWASTNLADLLAAPVTGGEDSGFGMCPAQVSATLAQVRAAGLPTVFFTRTNTTLPDAGGPGKGGIDHFDSSPLIGQIIEIAGSVLATVPCG